jgi:hypothetical protein
MPSSSSVYLLSFILLLLLIILTPTSALAFGQKWFADRLGTSSSSQPLQNPPTEAQLAQLISIAKEKEITLIAKAKAQLQKQQDELTSAALKKKKQEAGEQKKTQKEAAKKQDEGQKKARKGEMTS